jgi:hypothetical protein
MEHEKKIKFLERENEFLQSQLEDFNRIIKNKDEEISLLADEMESVASLRSKIDINLLEIEQLRYNNSLTEKKVKVAEADNETLENDLLEAVRKAHRQEKDLVKMNSVSANLDVVNNELEDAAVLYKKLQMIKKENAEIKSLLEISKREINELRIANAEQEEMIEMLRQKKIK